VTVTAYVPDALAVIAAVVADPPVAFHRYVPTPDAVRVPDPQKVLGPAGEIEVVNEGIATVPVRGLVRSYVTHSPGPLYEYIS
jgi:hypothetical protein